MTSLSGIIDFHVHSAPSLLPRRTEDPDTATTVAGAGVTQFVLKAHEGSTAARAALVGAGAIGGVALNSPVGGANPDAVEVAARLGGRVVWLPTVSSVAHQRAVAQSAELSVHRELAFRPVPVIEDGKPAPGWMDVLDVIAAHDLVLASGHVPVPDALQIFQQAHRRGARRFLVNHPCFDFLGWSAEYAAPFQRLDVHLEVGCVADLGDQARSATARLAAEYPTSLFVFGSDLGHTDFPSYQDGVTEWIGKAEPVLGSAVLDKVLTTNGQGLLQR